MCLRIQWTLSNSNWLQSTDIWTRNNLNGKKCDTTVGSYVMPPTKLRINRPKDAKRCALQRLKSLYITRKSQIPTEYNTRPYYFVSGSAVTCGDACVSTTTCLTQPILPPPPATSAWLTAFWMNRHCVTLCNMHSHVPVPIPPVSATICSFSANNPSLKGLPSIQQAWQWATLAYSAPATIRIHIRISYHLEINTASHLASYLSYDNYKYLQRQMMKIVAFYTLEIIEISVWSLSRTPYNGQLQAICFTLCVAAAYVATSAYQRHTNVKEGIPPSLADPSLQIGHPIRCSDALWPFHRFPVLLRFPFYFLVSTQNEETI